MDIDEKKFQFVARELYEGRLTKEYKLKKGILEKDDLFEIKSRSPGIVVIDSFFPEYQLKIDDIIKICPSKDYLNYIKIF